MLDVGETIVDETRTWGAWADWLGVPRLTFFAVLGAVLARGGQHPDVFELFRPGIDIRREVGRLRAGAVDDRLSLDDLYPDVLPTVAALAAEGYRLAVAANQPASTSILIATLGAPFEFIATSAEWGVAKPDPGFFGRIADELGLEPAEIAYVGDRVDNDVRPAAAAGMRPVFIRRGPWGWILAGRSDPPEAAATIGSLAELPAVLRRLGRG